jgi:FeS assembly SUF system protein
VSDQPSNKPMPLNVLPNSGKVEELRREFSNDPKTTTTATKNQADRNVIDRAIDTSKSPQQKSIEEKVIDVLRTIFDPEIPLNIYDLGLIYEINIDNDSNVAVKMTLTAPGCPVAGTLPPAVEAKIEAIEEVKGAKVELTWDPPWSRERMSEAALLQLGML